MSRFGTVTLEEGLTDMAGQKTCERPSCNRYPGSNRKVCKADECSRWLAAERKRRQRAVKAQGEPEVPRDSPRPVESPSGAFVAPWGQEYESVSHAWADCLLYNGADGWPDPETQREWAAMMREAGL